ncbi:MAG: lasso peptide biosynthesis PqqD family chaperone [Symploca sp. SIO2E9]|nr:lasso peptide biosynthesis PqqD family chaperone [Symploca sp. SIO2E9]
MTLQLAISKSSTVVAVKEQVSSDLEGESVILNFKSGTYYGLNTVGSSIWNLIQEPKTVSEVREAILEEYEVEPEQCEREILELLQQLAAKELIEVKNEAVA